MSCPAIVLTSLSGKIALYQAIREQVISHYEMARIIGADCDENCKAAPLVEEFIKIPPISDWSHHEVISFCKSEKISHIIPSRDGELDFWSQLAPELEENGIQVMVSSMEAINNCLDKYAFFQSYSQNSPIQPIPTTLRPEFLNVEKFVVKERYGHGSQTLGLDLFLENAKLHAQALEDPIFQPYEKGKELSAETWIDRHGKCHGMLLRWRIKVVNGESHETAVFEDHQLAANIIECLEEIKGLRGHVLCQLIIPSNGTPKMVEINPRLGGASPLALNAGINSILWFVQESNREYDKIPVDPAVKIGAKLYNEAGKVRIEMPFASRHDKIED